MAHLMRLKEQGGAAWPSAPKALLLSPTHELAAQTARVLKTLLPGSGLKCCLLSKKSAGVLWVWCLGAVGCGFLQTCMGIRFIPACLAAWRYCKACQAMRANPMQEHQSLVWTVCSQCCADLLMRCAAVNCLVCLAFGRCY